MFSADIKLSMKKGLSLVILLTCDSPLFIRFRKTKCGYGTALARVSLKNFYPFAPTNHLGFSKNK